MKDNPLITLIYVIALLIPILACGTSEAASNPFLENLLSASDDREFNKALSIYGSLQSEDVPSVVAATESFKERRRKNGAMMLSLCRQDNCPEAQADIVRKTKDIMVWAILIETAAKKDEKILRERPDLLAKALDSADRELLAPALRVAIKVDRDGIEEKIISLLDSKDSKILEVVLNNLSPAVAKRESPRLARMLADTKTYDDVDMELALALIRGADPQYYPNIKTFIDQLKKDRKDHSFFNEATFSEDKQMVDLLWKIVRMKDNEPLAEFRDQAYDALTRRVWAPDMREPITVELMEMSLVYLKQGSLETNPRAHINLPNYGTQSALTLVAFLNKGNTEFESRLFGKDAIAFTEKWLKEHK